MENPVLLSFRNWPTEPFSRNFRTSPTSLRVIKNAKVEIDSILPVSFAQYALECNLMNASRTETEQLYQREMVRRKKKVEILQGIWIKLKSKTSKSTKKSFSAKSSCLLADSKPNNHKRNSSKSFHAFNKKSKSKSPLFFNAKSPIKGSTYFDYYNTHHQNKGNNKKSYEEESTQSRREKTLSGSRSNDQYFNNNWAKKTGQKKNIHFKQELANSMARVLKKLADLERKHQKQLQQIGDLTEREKKRLLKIHEIEKEKLSKQIDMGRLKLNSLKCPIKDTA